VSLLVTQFADSTSGIGSLGINGKALIIQLVTFVLAFWVLQHWTFKPIIKMMQQRRKTIEDGVSLGEQMKKDKADLEAKVAEALHQARIDADKILADATANSRQAISEAETAARAKADAILAAADERIKQDISVARKRLEKDLAGLVSEATEAIIHEKVDAHKDASLMERALKRGVSA
jgi:F-type H+-transporting ATPase subunit b